MNTKPKSPLPIKEKCTCTPSTKPIGGIVMINPTCPVHGMPTIGVPLVGAGDSREDCICVTGKTTDEDKIRALLWKRCYETNNQILGEPFELTSKYEGHPDGIARDIAKLVHHCQPSMNRNAEESKDHHIHFQCDLMSRDSETCCGCVKHDCPDPNSRKPFVNDSPDESSEEVGATSEVMPVTDREWEDKANKLFLKIYDLKEAPTFDHRWLEYKRFKEAGSEVIVAFIKAELSSQLQQIRGKVEALRPTADDHYAMGENREAANTADAIYKFAMDETVDKVLKLLEKS